MVVAFSPPVAQRAARSSPYLTKFTARSNQAVHRDTNIAAANTGRCDFFAPRRASALALRATGVATLGGRVAGVWSTATGGRQTSTHDADGVGPFRRKVAPTDAPCCFGRSGRCARRNYRCLRLNYRCARFSACGRRAEFPLSRYVAKCLCVSRLRQNLVVPQHAVRPSKPCDLLGRT